MKYGLVHFQRFLENRYSNYTYSASIPQPSPLPYWPSGYPDLSSEYRNKQEESKEKEEIHEMYEGNIAD